jgi:hypothetical protein
MNIILEILEKIATLLIDIIRAVLNFIYEVLSRVYDKFLDVSIPEKIVFLNTVPAFLAVILPVARYYMFDTWFYINNSLAVYMLAIVIIMFTSLYFTGLIKLISRLLINAYYLFWIIYLPLAGEITKANPYDITSGYYINIAVPGIYIAASLFSYFYSYD